MNYLLTLDKSAPSKTYGYLKPTHIKKKIGWKTFNFSLNLLILKLIMP